MSRFLVQECHLFKFRLDRLDDNQRRDFMAANGLEFELISPETRAEKASKLVGLAGVVDTTLPATTFYK